jgi:LPPG:FO 2-phospho-L-lactate transferase
MNVEVLALTGGVGGAKLALGLARLLEARLACVVNTGDDFVHLGLHVSPDVDTLLYTLGDRNDVERGWGRRDETWRFMTALAELGGPAWFQLGDADLALHVERTRRLRAGETLTRIAADFAAAFGIRAHVLPMSDAPVATRVHTDEGSLGFQEYFVGRRAAPRVLRIEFDGADRAPPTPQVLAALAAPALRAIVLCPSNPYLSVDPLLALRGLRAALAARRVPCVAVCPLVGGHAVKGPTAKIMAELGVETTPAAIAAHYAGLIDGLVIDAVDAEWHGRCGVPTLSTRTLMRTLDDRVTLARETLEFAASLRRPVA